MTFATRFTELFDCRVPIQQASVGGAASARLAVAVADAGALGMLSGAIGAAALAKELDEVPFEASIGVNFLVPFIDPAAIELAAARVRYVEFFWGAPDKERVAQLHEAGVLAGWQVGSLDEARAASEAGCDVVVVQGVEAGGHVRGTVDLFSLARDARAIVDGVLIAAGGIGTARAVADAIAAGADAVRVGTRFLAALESSAHPAYVDALIAAGADDTVLTTAFGDGWPDAPHRVLRSCVEAGERRGAEQSWSPAWPQEDDAGPVEARALYAGESVGAVRSRQTAAEIVAELTAELV